MKKVNKLLTFIEEQKLEEGINQTIIPSLRIFKSSNVTQILHTVYEPSLFVIVQGRKIVSISRKNIEFMMMYLRLYTSMNMCVPENVD